MARWFSSPVHICLVGALVLSIGINSLVQILGSVIAGKGKFDLGFLLIFIGLGLLRGSSVQRGIFGALLALNLVVCVIVAFVFLIKGVFFGGEFEWEFLVGLAVIFVIFGYAREPFEFQVYADGYNVKDVEVNRYTGAVIEVSLYPNPHAKHESH